MRWPFGILVGLFLSSAVGAADVAPPGVGSLVVGMTVDAARAAVPSASWANISSTYTGKVIGTKADAAWTLDGQSYDVACDHCATARQN